MAFALVGLPYGVAFKLVTVLGVVSLPVCAYAFGRLAGLRFPTPAVFSAATLPFLFYRGYTIYGGNIASTLAGEFAFSISLSLGLLYLGVVFKGLETGRYRVLAAVLLALTGLCHIIPAFWVLGATAIAVAVRFRLVWESVLPGLPLVGAGVLVSGIGLALGAPSSLVGLGVLVLGAGTAAVGLWLLSASVRWITPSLVVGGLLSMWWVGPFYLRSDYLNDMGWEKLPYADEELSRFREWLQHLMPYATPDVDLRWVFGLALVGAAFSVVRGLRAGIFLSVTTVAVGIAFVVVPEGRLWNGRLLPFYYLMVMLLAGLAVSEVVRTIAELVRDHRRAPVGAGVPVALGTLAAVVLDRGRAARSAPGQRAHRDGHRLAAVLALAGARRARQLHPVVGQVELHRLRGQGRLPRVLRRRRPHGRGGRAARLRPGVLGVREGARPVRHSDGAHAAAALDRRVHRLDGGPVLRGVGDHPVPLHHPGRAVDLAERAPSATSPTARSTSPRASNTCR